MKRISILFFIMVLLSACGLAPAGTQTSFTPNNEHDLLPTSTSLATATAQPGSPDVIGTPKATESTPETVDPMAWQSAAEGKVLYQPGELLLFGRDQFTVNPELAEKLYSDVLLKFVYAVQRAGDPVNWGTVKGKPVRAEGFAAKYPTFESFAAMVAANPGATYDDLLLLDQHPDARGGTKSAVYGEWLPAGEGINLDKIVVDLATPEEAKGGNFIRIDGSVGFRMDTVDVEGKNVFRFTFTELLANDLPEYHLTDLDAKNTPEENKRTLTLALNLFAEMVRRKANESLVPNEGIVLTGKEPDAMDLTMPASSPEANIRDYDKWANGNEYFILADGVVSWDQSLDLYNASTFLDWFRRLVG